jgi:hypothetical protein
VGVNVTLIVQLAPDATELPQLLLCSKSPASAPAIVMLLMLKAAFPVFIKFTESAPLAVPTIVYPKVRLRLEKVIVGAATGVENPGVQGSDTSVSMVAAAKKIDALAHASSGSLACA